MKRPVVLCPLRYEAGFARRLLSDVADVVCFGPYKGGMERAFGSGELDDRPLVVVVGVGGGLTETGVCPAVERVVDLEGNAWTPSVVDTGDERVTVVGVDVIVPDEASKRGLARETGASVVDMETHVVARRAEERGMRWGVVRGVSDGPEQEFPAWVADLLDREGGVRPLGVATRLLKTPTAIGTLRKIGAGGKLAMNAACARARAVIEGAS